jgi:hypothetical protein
MEPITLRDYGRQYLGITPGTTLKGKDLDMVRSLYAKHVEGMDKAKTAFEPSAGEVILPDGSKRVALKTSPNSAQYEQPYQAPAPHYSQTEDGRIGMTYPDGRTVYAWDANSGQPVKAAKKVDPFAALLSGAPQSAPVGQSGATTLEPPAPSSQPPAPISQSAPAPAPAPAPAEPQVYSISGEEDYAKVPPGATVNWNGQTFTKR